MVLLQKWTEILGEHDTFYEVFDPDIQFGSETVTASVSENILDIYQDLKDFVMAYSLGNEEVMNDSLAECRSHFVEFWGQRLVNVLRALHQLTFSGFTREGEMRPVKPNAPERNSSDGYITFSDLTMNEFLSAFKETISAQEMSLLPLRQFEGDHPCGSPSRCAGGGVMSEKGTGARF